MSRKAKKDKRVERTRDRLGDALVALIREKPFDDIRVQDVLDRAGVGRSTFYVHFRDKVDLLLSDADEFFEHMSMLLIRKRDTSGRVAPVRELFAHVADVEEFVRALTASGRAHAIFDLGRDHFARAIERRLSRRIAKKERDALAYGYATALFALLTWWVEHKRPLTPEKMDDLFHRMIISQA
jgi:AcrR family transcriptional regulator